MVVRGVDRVMVRTWASCARRVGIDGFQPRFQPTEPLRFYRRLVYLSPAVVAGLF